MTNEVEDRVVAVDWDVAQDEEWWRLCIFRELRQIHNVLYDILTEIRKQQ